MINPSEYSDEELIGFLRGGETAVMDYLLEKYKPLVRKLSNALYLIGGETEDLIQEGMIGLFKAIRDYRPDRNTSFATFAHLCVSRQLYSVMENSRARKNQPLNTYVSFSQQVGEKGEILEDLLCDRLQGPEQLVLEQERIREFYRKLEKNLSPMEQQVLKMYLEGSNYQVIAACMNKEPKSIDNALQRIKKKIRAFTEDK